MPLLSLVIPVYNTEQYLDRCLNSVFTQTYKNIEVIVVNDCSPGDTDAIISKFQDQYSNLKYYRHEVNRGLFHARLTGASHSTGNYIAFLDSDDYVSIDFYRSLIEKAETTNSDIVIGRTVLEKGDGKKYVYNLHDSMTSFDFLENEDIKKVFWEQNGLCYSLHTVWNKIYRKDLWDKAFPFYHEITTHVIMTEDIAFSSILFYYATHITTVQNDCIFYCENPTASTNSSSLSIERYKKNVTDIITVFEFVGKFLNNKHANADIMCGYDAFRKFYAKMWRGYALTNYSGSTQSQALDAVEPLYPNLKETVEYEDHFFNTLLSPWNGGLEHAKTLIASSEIEIVSFDIFDTLITRPFYNPMDVFELLNPLFKKLMGTNCSFSKIRMEGEKIAREYWGKKTPKRQDITLQEIYDVIAETFFIPTEIVSRMKLEEETLEYDISSIRKSGQELFNFAHALNKKVILVSDMYLEKEIMEKILSKHGYFGFNKFYLSSDIGLTKNTGALMQYVLDDLHIAPNKILHIGDTWNNDIEKPKNLGFHTFFLPKALEAMGNRINGISTNNCISIGDFACSDIVNREKYKKSIGFGSMLSVVANKYFDNPYRYFNAETDFNQDPYFIGYYPVGMHVFGFVKWLIEQSIKYGYKKLYFMSRDGYLPMLVYKKLSALYPNAPEAEYLYTSRKALMPYILNSPYDLYEMPIEVKGHTPLTVYDLLKFCSREVTKDEFHALLKKSGIKADAKFDNICAYNNFITCFIKHLYDSNKHNEAKSLCHAYYSKIETTSATVDMGYSGRIQGAVSLAAGHGIDVFFIHSDEKKHLEESNAKGFHIHSFYDFSPCISGVFREHLLSSLEPSCIGFEMEKDMVKPQFEEDTKIYQDRFVVEKIHRGALDFATDFISAIGKYYEHIPIKSQEISLPYEGFLRFSKGEDLKIFDASFFEDTVYGAQTKLKVSQFLQQQYSHYNITNRLAMISNSSQQSFSDMLTERIGKRNKLIKFLVYFIADQENLRVKMWHKLQGKPRLFRITRAIYRRFFK